MEHILDYDILKEWGFVWATSAKIGEKIVVNRYLKENTYETDAHNFNHIHLSLLPHPNFGWYWEMSYLDAGCRILFKGVIHSKEALRYILESCVVFKPKDEATNEKTNF